jgi:hypothetical protein
VLDDKITINSDVKKRSWPIVDPISGYKWEAQIRDPQNEKLKC